VGYAQGSLARTFAELAESNNMLFTGDFPRESAMLHRLVYYDYYHTPFSASDEDGAGGVNWHYVRVVQANGQLAWSSPIRLAASTGRTRERSANCESPKENDHDNPHAIVCFP